MKLRTTLILIFFAAMGGLLFWLGPALAPFLGLASTTQEAGSAGTLAILQDELIPSKITRIEVRKDGSEVILERAGDRWTLPGHWRTRQQEVDGLVKLLTGLRTRFVPLPINDEHPLADYGLDKPDLAVIVHVGDKPYRLEFGEEKLAKKTKEVSGLELETNRFARPTYLRIDDRMEAVRLAPGLIAQLGKPADYYQQRRLFPTDRVARSEGSQEKVDALAAISLDITEKKTGAHLGIVRKNNHWEMNQPVKDCVDPDKVMTLLTAVPDLWAERFIDRPKKDLAEYGLKDPEQTVKVTLPVAGGDALLITLIIGKIADTKTRHVLKPSPPGLGAPPQMEAITEEFRFAKLENNDQIFVVKADKFKDIFVAAKDLRDPRLARFESKDVTRVQIHQAGIDIVLVKDKDKDHWKLEKPIAADAESGKVTEILEKLEFLEARDLDILDKDKKEDKTFGFDKPAATVTVTVEPKAKNDATPQPAKTFTFTIGKEDAEKKKLYVRVNNWERINAVEDSLFKLVQRPVLAYRGRRVLDFVTSAIDTIDVHRSGENLALKQEKGAWKLTAPAQADADGIASSNLANSLGNLETVEYVSETPKPEDLDRLYGLAKPIVTVTIAFSDKTKPVQTLLIGKARGDNDKVKGEHFAKLASAPSVFVIKKETFEALDKASLAYRPLQLWQVFSNDLSLLRIQKEGTEEYTLTRKGPQWRVAGPFDADVVSTLVQPIAQEIAGLHCDRYAAHTAKDLATYGLDKPYLRVALATPSKKVEDALKKDGPPAKEEIQERILLIGKTTAPDAHTRFAKLQNSEAIFVLAEKSVAALDHGALDLLDPNLLRLAVPTIQSIHVAGGATPMLLLKKEAIWHVLETPAPEFTADPDSLADTLNVWANLRAQKFVAYGPKGEAKLAEFGLDKPSFTITVKVQPPEAGGKKPDPVDHTLLLGKLLAGSEERYGRIQGKPGMVIVSAADVADLTRGYLDYVDRTVLKIEPETIKSIVRKIGNDDLELARRDEGWQILKPADQHADDDTLQSLVEQLAHLRGKKVAAFPAKDPKLFGLDAPAAVLTLKQMGADGKTTDQVINLGKTTDENNGDRFAQVTGSQTIVVVPATLVKRLMAAPLAFRNRKLTHFASADRVILERGPRKATFTKVDGSWKLTSPLEAEAEHAALEDYLNDAARLHADELVAEKPTDLKPYGLDKPLEQWRFYSGDKEVLHLLVGSLDKSGKRVHAKLANDGLVFLLDPALTARVQSEYRNRNVWPVPPDAAQVESLHYGYANNPFTLEKNADAWQVVGKVDVQVDTKAVSETLAAIAGLRAARFVVDKDADLKLYGLEPPQLVLEVATPSGKKTLHVGRVEGESKRFYGRIPDKDASAVFILSEGDSAKIVRHVARFAEPAEKSKAPVRP